MSSTPFPTWHSPTQRAYRTRPAAVTAKPKRLPFSGLRTTPANGVQSALKTAQIFLFTGSNTPYQSHE